jgi:hypothetical protein
VPIDIRDLDRTVVHRDFIQRNVARHDDVVFHSDRIPNMARVSGLDVNVVRTFSVLWVGVNMDLDTVEIGLITSSLSHLNQYRCAIFAADVHGADFILKLEMPAGADGIRLTELLVQSASGLVCGRCHGRERCHEPRK